MITCNRESALMCYQIFSTNAFTKYVENLYVNTRDERGKARRQFSIYLIYPRNVIPD